MDRFIAMKKMKISYKRKHLKSNMDRFIDDNLPTIDFPSDI